MFYALAFCLLLAVLLTVQALRRPDARHRGLRIVAGLGAAAGLGLAAFPPAATRRLPPATTAILLTDSYSPDTLRQLQRRLGSAVPVLRYSAALAADTPTVHHATAIRQQLPALRQLHVLGQGLPAADAAALDGLRVLLHADGRPTGFQQAVWPLEPQLGQPWAITGRFQAPGSGTVWVSLQAAGTARDSVRLPAGGGTFRLRFTPKAEGQAVYALEARRQGRRIAREPVPVQVQPTRALRILVLAATPSFETRFLKTELAARQHAVAVRTGLSRNLTQTEFLNLPNPPSLDRLTPALLARFDVVLADAPALTSLSAPEAQALQRAVQRGTSGLLLADAASLPRQLPAVGAFRLVYRSGPATALAQPLHWPDAPAQPRALLAATLQPHPALTALILGPQQQPVAATRRLGLGQIVVTTLTETFPWLLQNQPLVYHAYWSRLLSAAAPPHPVAAAIQLLSPWPHPNEPVLLRALGTTTPLNVHQPQAAPVSVALREDAHVTEWATGTYWPAGPGWHQARAGTASQWFYVYEQTAWRGPAYQEWQRAASQLSPAAAAGTSDAVSQVQHSVWPRWWGYVLFLLSAGLLWLEEKL